MDKIIEEYQQIFPGLYLDLLEFGGYYNEHPVLYRMGYADGDYYINIFILFSDCYVEFETPNFTLLLSIYSSGRSIKLYELTIGELEEPWYSTVFRCGHKVKCEFKTFLKNERKRFAHDITAITTYEGTLNIIERASPLVDIFRNIIWNDLEVLDRIRNKLEKTNIALNDYTLDDGTIVNVPSRASEMQICKDMFWN